MANFLLTFHGGSMPDSKEEQDQAIQAWNSWFGTLGDALVDGGNPISHAKAITPDGSVMDATSAPSGYSVIKADSLDAAVDPRQGLPGPRRRRERPRLGDDPGHVASRAVSSDGEPVRRRPRRNLHARDRRADAGVAARPGIADDPPARDRAARARRDDGDPHPTADEPWIRTLLGGAPDDETAALHPYHKWRGVHWRLVALAELDADVTEPAIAAAVAEGFDRVSAWVSGTNRIHASRAIDGRVRQCASMDGNAAWAATRLGLGDDPRVAAIVERLVAWQWPDGGWNCDKRPGCEHASFNESLPPLRALAMWSNGRRSALARDARAAADRAAEFLLVHHVDRSHRTLELAHPALDRLRWPPFWHYDRLQGLRALREAGRLDDPRTTDALASLADARRRRALARRRPLLARAGSVGDRRRGRSLGRGRRGPDAHDPGARGPPRGPLTGGRASGPSPVPAGSGWRRAPRGSARSRHPRSPRCRRPSRSPPRPRARGRASGTARPRPGTSPGAAPRTRAGRPSSRCAPSRAIVVSPKPVPFVFATSRTKSVAPATCCPARNLPSALASPNESVKSRSLSDTSIPLPVTPRWSASHSSSLKSCLVAMRVLRWGCGWGRSIISAGHAGSFGVRCDIC